MKKVERFIVSCDGCGFTYRDPALDEKDLQILYAHFRDMSLRNESPDEYFNRITNLPAKESENTVKVEWLKGNLEKRLAYPGKILDIGCGGGVFLYTFNKLIPGWKLHGIEPTSSFAKLAARRLGQPVIDGSYTAKLFDKKFDLITINQVLEHVKSPVNFLEAVSEDLAEGGFVYLEVPDVRDFDFLPDNHDRFHMQHLSILSKDSLRTTCQNAGYKIATISQTITIRGKNNINVILEKG